MENQEYYEIEGLAESLLKGREFRGLTLKDAAVLIGVPTSKLRNYELGKYIPSLPELESLSFIYGIPFQALFRKDKLAEFIKIPDADQLQQLIQIRNSIISTTLQIAFEESGYTLKDLSKSTGISKTKIKKYLSGSEIPFDELENLAKEINSKIQDLMDKESQLGLWQSEQKVITEYRELPEKIRTFLGETGNWDFLNLASRISSMDISQIQALSEAFNQLDRLRKSQD